MRVPHGLMFAALTAGLAGMAAAQEAAPDEEGAVEVEARAELSGPEQIAEAERVQEKGISISRRVQSMLDQARRERDIIRVTCLNDKLTQVNANLRTLEERIGNLQAAAEANDGDRRNHEYTVITVLAQKLSVLEQEANQCIGQDIFETGATRVVTDIDPATPDEDPTQLDETPDVDVPFIPPPLSPTA
ncbi:MAG: hypothetical protein ACOC97_04085 [Myxococcota bacterium]